MRRIRVRPRALALVAFLAVTALAAAACTNDYGGLRFPREQADGGDGAPTGAAGAADAASPDAP